VSRYVFKLPDLGEGTVEAEIVGWRVKPGDVVAEEDVIVEVMTEKAAVEVPAPVAGRVLSTTGAAGDMVPVGAELIVFETDAGATSEAAPAAPAAPPEEAPAQSSSDTGGAGAGRTNGAGNGYAHPARLGRVATSPAIRRRAHEAGVDLTQLSGSGPNGRILRRDFEAYVSSRTGPKLVHSRQVELGHEAGPVGA
jgi:2-oxoisovalerate dehydrogenase E2 component (dihydrolipoyl transacylase)